MTLFSTKLSTVVLAAILLSSCASIVSTSSNQVSIHTDPPGVNYVITNKSGKEIYKGKSPATVTLSTSAGFFTKAEYHVKLSASGFEEKTVSITYKLNGWYWGNIFLGGAIGMLIVDPATGAMWKIIDPAVNETMVKASNTNSTTSSTSPALNIVNIQDVSTKLQSHLVKLN